MAQPRKKDLTLKRVVDAIRPTKARYMVWDEHITGFGLDVWPSGRRSWILFYRVAGQQRRMKIGDAEMMAPDAAAAAARAARVQVDAGVDPLGARRATHATARATKATVADVAARYLSTLVTTKSSAWAAEAKRLFDAHIEPALGSLDVREVGVKHARALHEAMKDTPVSANRTKAVLSAIITRAIEDGDRARELLNPAGAVEDYPEAERDRYLTDKEWPRVAEAIHALRKELKDAPVSDTRGQQLDALLVLALTGARLRAILPRKWHDVDWQEHAIVVKPAHKGVNRVLLGETAESMLRTCFDARGAGGGFIFPGQRRRIGKRTARYERDTRPQRAPTPVSGLAPMWTRLQELAALDDFTLHDWRRTFATVAGDVGISDHMIGGLLGHRVPGVRRRYARRTDDALLEAATKVSAEVAKRLDLTFTSARKALPFTRAKGGTK